MKMSIQLLARAVSTDAAEMDTFCSSDCSEDCRVQSNNKIIVVGVVFSTHIPRLACTTHACMEINYPRMHGNHYNKINKEQGWQRDRMPSSVLQRYWR